MKCDPTDYGKGSRRKRPNQLRRLPPEMVEDRIRVYYDRMLRSQPDVLGVKGICAITWYGHSAVGNWLRKGRLRYIMNSHKYYVPKCWLIDYLCSPYYADIRRKSRCHVKTLWDIYAGREEAGV